MHKQNMVHRDIKPQNILISQKADESLLLKITDFGFASLFDPQNEEGDLNMVLGTPLYMAPEILEKKKYNSKVDIWSTGIIAFMLLTGNPPFVGKTKEEVKSEMHA